MKMREEERMTSRLSAIFEIVKSALLAIIAVLLVLILIRMPPTIGDRLRLAKADKATRSEQAKRLRLRTPIIEVEGAVEANVANSPLEVEVKNAVTIDPETVVTVEAKYPLPVEIER